MDLRVIYIYCLLFSFSWFYYQTKNGFTKTKGYLPQHDMNDISEPALPHLKESAGDGHGSIILRSSVLWQFNLYFIRIQSAGTVSNGWRSNLPTLLYAFQIFHYVTIASQYNFEQQSNVDLSRLPLYIGHLVQANDKLWPIHCWEHGLSCCTELASREGPARRGHASCPNVNLYVQFSVCTNSSRPSLKEPWD